MRGYKRLDQDDPDRLLWGVYQFAVTCIIIGLIAWPIVVWAEQVWTDFSPEPEAIEIVTDETPTTDPDIQPSTVEGSDSEGLDKEKYRQYFEDKSLVLMVLGGLEYWKMNCGELSDPGNYFMNLAIKKHDIDPEEMDMTASFQTGLFAAQLYNNCDIFLEQTKSIGLDMMLKK
jgi:hypothetical protein|tara:strand:+ start:317 stop:835 length:519 start_codon:yes stop_codon:yes gene_type:complete